MIQKTATGAYKVVSEKGVLMSRTDLTYGQAVARLAQCEKFKTLDNTKKKDGKRG